MFYGGIAPGVVLIARSSAGTPATLTSYLFGAILTTTTSDIIVFAVLAAVVLATTLVLRPRFFAVANDEEYARAQGMPVLGYNVVLAVLTAVTVVVSMRIVGLLLISALMILPNATSLFARSFKAALWWAVAIGVACSVGGVIVSYYAETPSGGTIVLLAVGAFLVASTGAALAARARRAAHALAERHDHEHGPDCGHLAVDHGDHVDYLHDGHRHAAHEGHYDEHAEVEPR